MKTTFDLPPELVRKVKLRAVHEGRKVKDVAAELLQRGLDQADAGSAQAEKVEIAVHPVSGLPYVKCRNTQGFTPPTLEESLALIQHANEEEDLRRAGLLD